MGKPRLGQILVARSHHVEHVMHGKIDLHYVPIHLRDGVENVENVHLPDPTAVDGFMSIPPTSIASSGGAHANLRATRV
jgi:hypothetical protein